MFLASASPWQKSGCGPQFESQHIALSSTLGFLMDRARFIVPSEDCAVDVGPKLLEDVKDTVNGDLRQPLLPGLSPCAFRCGVVKVGNTAPAPFPIISEKLKPLPPESVFVMIRRLTA